MAVMERKMPISPNAIANYFLDLAAAEKRKIDPLKLQKLVYYAHGWNLAIHGRPLIDERVDAWPYGPVIPTLYHEFKRYGRDPIEEPALEWNGFEAVPARIPDGDGESRALLQKVWEEYGRYSGIELSNMTHREGTPWHDVWRANGGHVVRGTDILDEDIRRYFVDLVRKKHSS